MWLIWLYKVKIKPSHHLKTHVWLHHYGTILVYNVFKNTKSPLWNICYFEQCHAIPCGIFVTLSNVMQSLVEYLLIKLFLREVQWSCCTVLPNSLLSYRTYNDVKQDKIPWFATAKRSGIDSHQTILDQLTLQKVGEHVNQHSLCSRMMTDKLNFLKSWHVGNQIALDQLWSHLQADKFQTIRLYLWLFRCYYISFSDWILFSWQQISWPY